ncbi:hypothetical protein F5Y15DRAFT_428565 [Xylariaceae sp. FL0016]|nr:hypothetical protein F5Y15DRAFT_428565 [Xylariaceae sp. FL0016]
MDSLKDVSDLEKVKVLQARLAKLESQVGNNIQHSMEDTEASTPGDTEYDQGSSWTTHTAANTIPKVRKCNFTHFKNRFGKEDGSYAVDVLVSGSLLGQEESAERKLRERLTEQRLSPTRSSTPSSKTRKAVNKKISAVKQAHVSPSKAIHKAQGRDVWIHRIRIQSPALLSIFAKDILPSILSLIYYNERVKGMLGELEERWGHLVGEEEQGQSPAGSSVLSDTNVLRSFVDFMEKEIMPEYRQFEKLDWTNSDSTTARNKYDDDQYGDVDDDSFQIVVFYVDFNGDEFFTRTKTFYILPYKGSCAITSLPIYPIGFMENWEPVLQNGAEIGEKVLHYLEVKHGLYNGWTWTRTPERQSVLDPVTGAFVKHAEHVHSEVMVDYIEAFQAYNPWKLPKRVLCKQTVAQDRTHLLFEVAELVPVATGIDIRERNSLISEDPLLSAMVDNENKRQLTTADYLGPRDLPLLPGRVFAYVFSQRRFAPIDVLKLQPVNQTTTTVDALKWLRIRERAKDMIQGCIRGHLMQKASEKLNGEAPHSFHIIQGKGAGLFSLLHGVPGVGETATAEAMAQAHGKPLFTMTSGELSLTPAEVETGLRAIFRLASLWGCILLLDEVDTFFARRSKGDSGGVGKNAIVSVFLRVLDYYTGILFLTTKRVGILDEAFGSQIWQNNINRLRLIEDHQQQHFNSRQFGRLSLDVPEKELLEFAAGQFDGTAAGGTQWNGRQIRNAFQVARSLALADADPQPVLSIGYFHLMHNVTEEFDAYMREVYHGTGDADLARESEYRADHWPQSDMDNDSVNSSSQPQPCFATGNRPGNSWRSEPIRGSVSGGFRPGHDGERGV